MRHSASKISMLPRTLSGSDMILINFTSSHHWTVPLKVYKLPGSVSTQGFQTLSFKTEILKATITKEAHFAGLFQGNGPLNFWCLAGQSAWQSQP